ncbi:flagellar biosynthesis protein FlgL [Sphingomonas sp. MG17]|uniref:Flagellin n=1 Tax=Sphingomonas tagetis TaxID=2949092 RepID=A0A9X2KNF9_9SPHN|nr:flagellin [Sphingomonas tagetis]MCP3732820.1 flagellar biosynthesis protein FlgL [Sphingomonas tagetis]
MRVTTAQSFERPTLLMASLNKRADTLQTQIATGSKILAPSDSASGWQQLAGLKRAASDDGAYDANIKTAQSLLADTEGALDAVETQLQRAKAFAIQANSDTVSAEGRAAILKDVEAIIADLLGVVNAKDSRGYPLFGGASGDVAYARQAVGSIAYVGTGEAAPIPVADGVSITATETGARAFGGIAGTNGATDMFAILTAFAAALQPGAEDGGIETAMDDLDAALDQVNTTRASVGARAFRMDLEAERLIDADVARETTRSGIEDVDTSEAIAQLQKTLTILQATQASFTKLTSMSLFDYLR